jgi:hypothetical protein
LTRSRFAFNLQILDESPKCWQTISKGFDGLSQQSRDLYVLLSWLRCAGVFSGLDSEIRISFPDDPLATRRGGFFIFSLP